jgi:hypothetical protein
MIYSEDHGLRKFAASQGLAAQCTNDLPENPESKQQTLDLTVSADSAKPNQSAYTGAAFCCASITSCATLAQASTCW